MDDTVFHRFLRPVREDVPITLVTSDLRIGAGRRDQLRHVAFLDTSRLFAQERGPTHYRLVLQPAGLLHDRWMRFDGKRLLNLGGSAKDAGERQYFWKQFVVPGNPMKSPMLIHPLAEAAGGDRFHAGGKHWKSQSDPEWRTLAAWVLGETTGGSK